MKRFQRLPIYFITACSHKREPILNDPDIHEPLIQFATEGEETGRLVRSVRLNAESSACICCIDDERVKLGTRMKSLKNAVSKVLRQRDVPPPHWQKGFFDHILRSADSYSEKSEYVRENPVRAGLVSTWIDWPFVGEIFDLEFRKGAP